MKKIIVYIIVATVLLPSCQDELAEDFKNPGVYAPKEEVVSGMFTAIVSRNTTGFIYDYGECWYQEDGGYICHSELYARYYRTAYAYLADRKDHKVGFDLNGVQDRFNNLYSNFREMPLMKNEYSKIPAGESKDLSIYLDLTTMIYNMRAARNVDLFNSIPYFDAIKGFEGKFFAAYDDPAEIYLAALDSIKNTSDNITARYAQMSDDGKKKLTQQDVIFQGNIPKWVSYADAMRLRMAVRISGVLETQARAVISDVLGRGNLPTADLEISPQLWFRSNQTTGDGGTFRRGMRERDYAGFVPPLLTQIMSRDGKDEYTEGIDDPRMPVLFTPCKGSDVMSGLRVFRPANMDCVQGQANYESRDENNQWDRAYITDYNYFWEPERYFQNWYMCYNIATFIWNHEPNHVFSVAEVDLLKAEIALKGLGNTGKSAAEHLYDAVIHSTDYWYRHNSLNDWGGAVNNLSETAKKYLMPPKPSDEIITANANTIRESFNNAADVEDKMEIIMQQKFVHLNMHDPMELFTELRRTRHPKLNPLIYNPSIIVNTPLSRLPYPMSEAQNNFDNYLKVQDQDNFDSPIFWMGDKAKVSYYKD